MTMTPGDYLRLRREAAGLSIEDVAARIETAPHVPHRDRAAWLKAIENGIAPLSNGSAILLRFMFRFDPVVLDTLAARVSGYEVEVPAICRLCGCSEFDACGTARAPCAWADEAKSVCDGCANLCAPDLHSHETRPGTFPPGAQPGVPA